MPTYTFTLEQLGRFLEDYFAAHFDRAHFEDLADLLREEAEAGKLTTNEGDSTCPIC